jgi:hypothetical protein
LTQKPPDHAAKLLIIVIRIAYRLACHIPIVVCVRIAKTIPSASYAALMKRLGIAIGAIVFIVNIVPGSPFVARFVP